MPLPAFPGLRSECHGEFDFSDEVGNGEQLVSRRHSGCHSHVGKGAIDEVARSYRATVQYSPGRPGKPYIASFDGGNGESRGVDEVTQLVDKKAQFVH
jgi:hypothetical protein